ncbi:YhdT family protein [Dethiobacter alkaliphilus]|uniref:YhdT family protein n=1 Tax=Dethiobacter alkaliphilus TaxID=427926 RepID=UPI002226A75B|nr:YhdT family protein [Dethiobacter alkaliphilus]MCW3489361.1 YhdT family protein [Dethiobacter alkaliphilus]
MTEKINTDDANFVEDPRYKQCNREALLGLGLGIANFIWWFAWGYGFGSQPVEGYTYILGFPLWFFMSSIVGAILFTVLAIIMVRKYFRDMPLGPLEEDELKELQEGGREHG